MSHENSYIVTVMAKDRVGIIARITRAIADLGGTVDELSQTVMRGYFTIILAARFSAEVTAETLQATLTETGKEMKFSVSARQTNGDMVADLKPVPSVGDLYVLTVRGADAPGIIARITSYLASQDINIEDFSARAEGGQFLMVLQIRVAGQWDADELRLDLEALGNEIGMRAYLQHEAIFRATNEIGDVRRMIYPNGTRNV